MLPLRALGLSSLLLTGGCTEIQFGSGGTGGIGAGGDAGAAVGGEGAGGGASGGGGAGGAPAGEQCLNGLDDDDDGFIDCEDPECESVTCVEIPPGWLGPIMLSPTCGGDFSDPISELVTAVSAPPAACTCSCGAPVNACEEFALRTYGGGNCNGPSAPSPVVAGDCEALTDIAGDDSFGAEVSPDIGGSCAPSAITTLAPAEITSAQLCEPPVAAGGCDAGVCAPKATLCIYQSGQAACPPGFGNTTVAFETTTDSRGCVDACGCGSVSGSCEGTVSLFASQGCDGSPLAVAPIDACGSIEPGSSSVLVNVANINASCAPDGASNPTGGVAGANPVTVCCAP